MKSQYLKISSIPAILLGEQSDKVFLFIHGQGGNKEEAKTFAEVACKKGWQVIGIDLPEHGQRDDCATFDPWHAVTELRTVMEYVKSRWKSIAVRANSIGSYFTLLAFPDEPLVKCLLVSPLVDMERMIKNLMSFSGITEEELEQKRVIDTDFGQTLSWEYLCYVRNHKTVKWTIPTCILRAQKDEMIDEDTVVSFSNNFGCMLTITEEGEHWFHTPQQLLILREWEDKSL